MSIKENLRRIIKSLNEPIKVIAEQIGISHNTLSNIINGKVEPNAETLKKIVNYLKTKGFEESDLYKEESVINNFRIRTNKELSGYEKSLVQQTILDFADLLKESDKKINIANEYFDYCDQPTDDNNTETQWDRKEKLLKAVETSNDLYKTIYEFYFAGRSPVIYSVLTARIEITYLLDMLGIRVFFKSLKTEKITSCSTVFKTNQDNPIILINTYVCKTFESILYEMCKQLYFLLKAKDDYNHSSNENIQLENQITLSKAEKLADKIMLNIDSLNQFIDEKLQANRGFDEYFFFKRYYFDYVINWIKRDFRVSYKVAIKQLLKSKFEYNKYLKDFDNAEAFYKECLLRSEKEYENKTPYIDNEPFPLSTDFSAIDASRFLRYSE